MDAGPCAPEPKNRSFYEAAAGLAEGVLAGAAGAALGVGEGAADDELLVAGELAGLVDGAAGVDGAAAGVAPAVGVGAGLLFL